MGRTCVGLDIGSSSVKVVQLKEGSKGFKLVNFGIEPLPAQTIVDGSIMNQSAVVEAIRSLKNALKLKAKEVATAISGHSVIIKKIKVPQMSPEELEEQIPWEAEHHIPFSKDDVEIDHQLVSTQNSQGQMELLLVAAKKEVVSDYTMVIREAKLQPTVMDVAAFTIQNAFEVNYEVKPGEGPAGELFWVFYWVATGLHAIHLTIGIGLVAYMLAGPIRRGEITPAYYTPLEVVGIYWSFVDTVWLFLYPCIYLVGRS